MKGSKASVLMIMVAVLSALALVACDTGGPAAQPTQTSAPGEPTETTVASRPTRVPTKAPTRAAATKTSTASSSGSEVISEDGGFKIRFPAKPAFKTETRNDPTLGNIDVNTYDAKRGSSEYSIVWLDYPDVVLQAAEPEALLDKVLESLAGSNTLDDKRAITENGNPGLQAKINMGDQGYVRYTSVLAGNRLYQAIAVMPDDVKDAADANSFLNSFELLDGATSNATPTRSAGRATPTRGASTDGWQTYNSAEGAFTLEFPGTPKEGISKTNSALGELTLYTFEVLRSGEEFTMLYVDYPDQVLDADPQQLLQGAFTGVLGSNTATDQQEINVQGNPGLSGEFEAPQGYVRYMAVLQRNRLYQLITIGKDENATADDTKRFFESFRLMGGANGLPTEEGDPFTEPTEEPEADETPVDGSNSGTVTPINASGTYGDVRITVHSSRIDDGSEFLPAKDGQQFLVLDVSFENTGTKNEAIAAFFSKLEDSEGNEYDMTFLTTVKDSPGGNLEPKAKVRGEIPFEIPVSARGLTFTYDPLIEDVVRIKLNR